MRNQLRLQVDSGETLLTVILTLPSNAPNAVLGNILRVIGNFSNAACVKVSLKIHQTCGKDDC